MQTPYQETAVAFCHNQRMMRQESFASYLIRRRMKVSFTPIPYWFIAAVLASAALRYPFLDGVVLGIKGNTRDLGAFASYYLRLEQQSWPGLSIYFTKLNSTYLYLWTLVSALDPFSIPPALAVKLCSAVFDYACAYWVFRLVRLCYPAPSPAPYVASLYVLFAPTVLINASWWGQLDSTFTSFLLASVFFLVRLHTPHASRHDTWYATICFAIAFCFKLQSVFLVPALAFLYGKKIIQTKHLTLIILFFIAVQIPRFALGLPIESVFKPYPKQISWAATTLLAGGSPTLYMLPRFSNFIPMPLSHWVGIVLAALFTLFAYWAGRKTRHTLSPGDVITISLTSLMVTVFVLPFMLQRYFFPADVLSIVAAFYYRKLIPTAIICNFVSLFCCLHWLIRHLYISFTYLTLLMMIGIFLLLRFAWHQWNIQEANEKNAE